MPRVLRLFLGLGFAVTGGMAAQPAERDFTGIFHGQLTRYPDMQVQDAYKLLMQAYLGTEHAVDDAGAAERWMQREVATMGAGPVEPLVDPITPDGRLVRVHLRPFLDAGGDPKQLVQAFVQAANLPPGSRAELAAAWAGLVRLAETGSMPWAPDELRKFGAAMAAEDWPAVHHSPSFTAAYRPAYRVIAREFLPGCLPPKS